MNKLGATKKDLDTIANNKQNKLTAGANITIVDNVISSTGGGGTTYTEMTQAQIDTGTSNTSMVISPKLIKDNLNTKENVTNKVTTITSSSTNTQYPTAKAVYDMIGDIESVLDSILGV